MSDGTSLVISPKLEISGANVESMTVPGRARVSNLAKGIARNGGHKSLRAGGATGAMSNNSPFRTSASFDVTLANDGHVLKHPCEIDGFLDEAADKLASVETIPTIWASLLEVAKQFRGASGEAAWHQHLRDHRITTLIHEEPAIAWAYRKPRGYSGDAHLIDFLYEHQAARHELLIATPRGRAMNAMVVASTTSVAVQERRRLLAGLLDATAERVSRPEALVLACGHLREVECATALDRFDRIVALDQDSASIAEMRRCYGDLAALIPVEASIGRMIVRPLMHGQFDVIYAAGLYDYLDDVTAMRLTNGMLSALKPGGRLLFANFCTDVRDYAFMDAFMDWRLILRDETEMLRLIDALPAGDIARVTLFRGLNRAVIYALVEKR